MSLNSILFHVSEETEQRSRKYELYLATYVNLSNMNKSCLCVCIFVHECVLGKKVTDGAKLDSTFSV